MKTKTYIEQERVEAVQLLELDETKYIKFFLIGRTEAITVNEYDENYEVYLKFIENNK
jgi:hypothetical protein